MHKNRALENSQGTFSVPFISVAFSNFNVRLLQDSLTTSNHISKLLFSKFTPPELGVAEYSTESNESNRFYFINTIEESLKKPDKRLPEFIRS